MRRYGRQDRTGRPRGSHQLDLTASYVSAIRTSDGGCFDQVWATDRATRPNGWIYYAANVLSGSLNHNVLLKRISPAIPSHCGREAEVLDSSVHDVWKAPAPVTFETGKTLNAIVASRFAHKDLTRENNALERTYFTREYGFTRWEAWVPLTRCLKDHAQSPERCDPDHPRSILRGRCAPRGIPALESWGNQRWVRVDCRDSTNVIALKKPVLPLTPKMGADNGPIDVDMASLFADEATRSWPANDPAFIHAVGSASGAGWDAAASGKPGILTQGPQLNGDPAGHLQAEFQLRIDNNSVDNAAVLEIDVRKKPNQTVIAKRTVTRKEFEGTQQSQTFILPFLHDGADDLEFRVSTLGNARLHHAGTRLRPRP